MCDFLRTVRGISLAATLLAGSVCAWAQAQGVVTGTNDAAGSGVRIVRLSAVRGQVELDRGTGRGFETGFMNLPIVQGSRLRTVGLGWAEVEFEDGGSARITPETQVDFKTLARGSNGQLRSEMTLNKGTLYVSRMKGDKSDLVVMTGARRIYLPPASHVRLDVYASGSELVVVHGSVRVEDESGVATIVDHRHALKFGGSEGAQLVQAKGEAPGLYDRWDAASAAYHEEFTGGGGSSANGTGNQYGVRDMQYYGSFSDVSGCGYVWRPYLASAGFDPASSGVWAFYPGAGYHFASPYAWGWTAFNSGSWTSCGAQGWGWRPGAWVGLKNHGIVEPISGPGHHPRPVNEPEPGKPTFVAAGEGAISSSKLTLNGTSHFEKDSGGIGIPRGVVSNLSEISKAVVVGKNAPEPMYAGDLVSADPVALTMLAHAADLHVPTGRSITVRELDVAANSRPVAPALFAGSHPGGYANLHTSGGAGLSWGNAGGMPSGGRAGGVSGAISSIGGAAVGASSRGSAGGPSSGGGHK